jgi:hypothetical protein
MFARFCRFSSSASHSGRFVRWGGMSAFVGPWARHRQHLVAGGFDSGHAHLSSALMVVMGRGRSTHSE